MGLTVVCTSSARRGSWLAGRGERGEREGEEGEAYDGELFATFGAGAEPAVRRARLVLPHLRQRSIRILVFVITVIIVITLLPLFLGSGGLFCGCFLLRLLCFCEFALLGGRRLLGVGVVEVVGGVFLFLGCCVGRGVVRVSGGERTSSCAGSSFSAISAA